MAPRESATNNGRSARRAWFVTACLVVLFVAALFLRAYWNLDAAHPTEDQYVLSGGSDPYYHKHAADAIQASGFQHHRDEPLLNYPIGYENPNPPLYEWIIASGGHFLGPLFGGDVEKATWEVAIWSPALFGALTLIPIYFLGAALFDRRAGLVAALLWTVSTSAIEATGLGLADHDAAVIFFVTLAFLFYIQAIRQFRGEGNWIARWSDTGAVSSGVARLVRERRGAFAYALLSGVSIAAVALTWKGFNYVIGILVLYAGIMIIADHFRNRDSTGLFLGTLTASAVGVFLALPYYAGTGVANFLTPTWFILGGFLIGGIVLTVTRDLPSILVLPIAVLLAALGFAAAFFVFPAVAQTLRDALVYFNQGRLYQTISEAQPADFSDLAFALGPVPYLLALFGWFILLFRVAARPVQAWIVTAALLTLALVAYVLTSRAMDGRLALPIVGTILGIWLLVMFSLGDTPVGRAHSFALLWAAVALFMASAMAVRFVINAIPIFAVFAGFTTIWVLDWFDFGAIRKALAANRGNFWQGLRKGTRPMHVLGAVLIALLVVMPATLFAADAAMPRSAEQRIAEQTESDFVARFFNQRMGAYGGGFDTVQPWLPAFKWLDAYGDRQYPDLALEDRPAFLSWWDYGHWAVAVGQHPTVADNFQNGYEFAAAFILAKDEAHAIQLLAARTAQAPGADVQAALTEVGSADAAGDAQKILAWERAELSIAQSSDLLARVEEQTGRSIRYFATDVRMLPYDHPQTQTIDAGSIFAAPVRLAGEEPDDYVTTIIQTDNQREQYVTQERFRELASDPIQPTQLMGYRYEYQPQFFSTMFWRTFVGTGVQPEQAGGPTLGTSVAQALGNPRPSSGLEHFRAVYIGNVTRVGYLGGEVDDLRSYLFYPDVIISEYYRGATLQGTVSEDSVPLANVTITLYDDAGRLVADAYNSFKVNDQQVFNVTPDQFNVPHAQTITDESGAYTILSPFSLEGSELTIVASRGGVEVARTTVPVTRAQAEAGETIAGVDLAVQRGSVDGFAFYDANADGLFDEANETRAGGVDLTIGDVRTTTDDAGNYAAADVSAGLQTVSTDLANYTVGVTASQVSVPPGSNVSHNVPLELRLATFEGRLVADPANGSETMPVGFQPIVFAPDESVAGNSAVRVEANTEAGGQFNVRLRPGTYLVTSTWNVTAGETYVLSETLVVAPGETLSGQEFVMARQDQASSP